MSQPSFYVLSEGQSKDNYTHDTSRADSHHHDLATFCEDVNNAAKFAEMCALSPLTPAPASRLSRVSGERRCSKDGGTCVRAKIAKLCAFPNRGRSRYETVHVCLIRWEYDGLGVRQELNTLDAVLQDYGFQTNIFLIPEQNSQWNLTRRTLDFIQDCDNEKNLFILYYAGHGRMNSSRQSEWCSRQDSNSPFVDWSAIQGLFGTAKSDVLILLDTCAAASSATSSVTTSQYAVMETIAACGFERKAAPPGEDSMTNALVDVLRDWINKTSFSAASLHTEVLFRLKLKGKRKDRNGVLLEWCVTPIHWINAKDSMASAIEICRLNVLPLPSTTQLDPLNDDDASTFVDAMDVDSDNTSAASIALSSVSSARTYKVPRVLISLQLEEDQSLDAEQCTKWLDKFPLLAKWVKVEAVFVSVADHV
ncbi:uncharacterized protein PAC_15422 [Phialocephala subalpina]|uniref:Peptidase C14 caspase domain-containing protein n=1 Tax=Phialocephala subalpina TaxID=576137 RepID=A0A1L7XKF3_9HELO|nr:uncharacterized protein PAC_15422 [Phialocephala subalpina]